MGETMLSQVTRMRLLDEMLGSARDALPAGTWSVLLMDAVTTRIMSSVAGVADVLEWGVSLVDDVNVPRQPAPSLGGVYFITPSERSVRALVADFSRKGRPQHAAAAVFFSSPPPPQALAAVRGCPALLERLTALREVNLEYALVDRRSFSTLSDGALPALFGGAADAGGPEWRAELSAAAGRLATLFATLKEFPSIRFRAAPPPGGEAPPGLEGRLLAAQRLAVELADRLAALQAAGLVPERETCELLITDRCVDPVAPAIHEWTYEAAAHDLLEGSPALPPPGGVFVYEARTAGGKAERREHALDERDPVFLELRHAHLAAASLRIAEEAREVQAAAAKAGAGGAAGGLGGLDLRAMARLVQALPQFRDRLATLSAHVELASQLNRVVELFSLADLGRLEQDLVYGDATSKEVVAFLSAHQALPAEHKVRLLLCYSATHLEKLDGARQAQWMRLARLSADDMAAVAHLEHLGVPVCKRARGAIASAMGFARRRRRAVRRDRAGADGDEESEYALSRFVPLLAEVLEDAAAGRLGQDEYPFVRPPATPSSALGGAGSPLSPAPAAPAAGADGKGGASFRSVRSMGSWARAGGGGGGSEGGSRGALAASGSSRGALPASGSSRGALPASGSRGALAGSGGSGAFGAALGAAGPAARGGCLFAFVIGGFTYSELRAVHKLSSRLGRDVLLGGTGVQTPAKFVRELVALGADAPPPPMSPAARGEVEMVGRRR